LVEIALKELILLHFFGCIKEFGDVP